MKNQYFGDSRDFFKYDLVLTLLERINNLKQFTFIPMLTRDDDTSHGNLTSYDGARRRDLESFLKQCVDESSRNIRHLRSFMSNYKHIKYYPYKDDEYFTHATRGKYFEGIPPNALNESVILIDQDTGLEVKSMQPSNGHKYLKYGELYTIFDRMGTNSTIVVYQHIPHENREAFFTRIGEMIRGCMNTKGPLCLSDNQIAFFFLMKTDILLNKTREIINDYAIRNGYIAFP
ncbi:hypothetical protein ACFLVI_03430 [Chloroflexota bacterium]